MTETIGSSNSAPDAGQAAKKPRAKGGGLNSMLLADLKAMAGGMGIAGAGSMKKAQLVDAIKSAQSGGSTPTRARTESADRAPQPTSDRPQPAQRDESHDRSPDEQSHKQSDKQSDKPTDKQERQPDEQDQDKQDRDKQDRDKQDRDRPGKPDKDKQQDKRGQGAQGAPSTQGSQPGNQTGNQPGQGNQPGTQTGQGNPPGQGQPGDQGDFGDQGEDGEGRAGRNRRRRGRDRNRTGGSTQPAGGGGGGGGGHRNEPDTTVLEDDVLVPAAGILDVLDNYAFVRTSGYLAGPGDVYLSLSMVRKYGLRRGDAVVGQVRQPREGERKEKFNPMVRIDSINGGDPDGVRQRVEFDKLTPLHPTERLRMETGPDNLIGRIIDIAAPIGKGQRGLILSPAKAGKTKILQSLAASITANNPECHLMVVLVDERPEEVTDFERSVKGEVIASTFDRPAVDHTTLAELAVERAKRLVELGHDVVMLLDGVTRLGRAYHFSMPASGRMLAGGADASALYPPKRFFGAARNLENGGSLTILATVLVESGSAMDEVILEEIQSTANMELRLRRELADHGLFPAVDAVASGTRSEELLMGEEELAIVRKLRRALAGQEPQQALELLLGRIGKTHTNIEFLMQVQKTTPGSKQGD